LNPDGTHIYPQVDCIKKPMWSNQNLDMLNYNVYF
jgi:hypothetical protein